MTPRPPNELAKLLRAEAQDIHHRGLTDFFRHTYTCLRYGQSPKEKVEDRCGECPMRRFVPADYLDEAYPCQHIEEQGWNLAAEDPGLAEQYITWLLRTADELESASPNSHPGA